MILRPRSKNPITEDLAARIEDAGIETLAKNRWNTYRLVLDDGGVQTHSELLVEFIRLSRDAYGF